MQCYLKEGVVTSLTLTGRQCKIWMAWSPEPTYMIDFHLPYEFSRVSCIATVQLCLKKHFSIDGKEVQQ